MENSIKKRNLLNMLPVLLIVFFVPLAVHLKIMIFNGDFYSRYTGTTDSDFYSYYKMFLFLVFTGMAFIILILKFCAGILEIKKSVINYYMAIYSVFVFLSLLASTHKSEALWGFMSRYEGTIVLIGYILICFYTFITINSEADLWSIIYVLAASTFLVGVIGISQLVGHDFLQTSIGKHLITFGIKGFDIKTLVFTLEKYMVYGTLYHADYMGSFAAMIFIIFLSLFFVLKKRNQKLIFGFMSFIMLLNLIGSQSRAGMFGAALALIILLIVYNRYLFKIWKQVLIVFIGGALVLVVANAATGGSIMNKVKSLYLNSTVTINEGRIEDVKIDSNSIMIKTHSYTLNVSLSQQGFIFKDSDNKIIPSQFLGGRFIFNDIRYKDCFINVGNVDNNLMLAVHIKDLKLVFGITSDGIKIMNWRNELVNLSQIMSFGFKGHEQLGSGRGYIWSRTIPLLKDTILVGHGADTFAMYFPQDDYIGKLITYGDMKVYVDKPHNMYLQTAVNTGLISLIAMLGIFITYIIQSIKLYFRSDFSDIYAIFGVSIFCGVIAYLTAGFFNDSVLSVAPVFWILLGTGISINLSLKNRVLSKKNR